MTFPSNPPQVKQKNPWIPFWINIGVFLGYTILTVGIASIVGLAHGPILFVLSWHKNMFWCRNQLRLAALVILVVGLGVCAAILQNI